MPVHARFLAQGGCCALALIVSLVALGQCAADEITLSATDAGFVTAMGGSAKGDGTVAPPATYNYSAGWEEHYGDGALGSPLVYMPRKNYLVFDLTSVTGIITGASLKLYAGPDTGDPYPDGMHGYESFDDSEIFEIFETTDPTAGLALADELITLATVAGSDAFDAAGKPGVTVGGGLFTVLGDGSPLSGIELSSSDDDTIITMDFSEAALGYLNLFVGERLILAGGLSSLSETDGVTEGVFGYTGPDIPGGDVLTPTLELTTVPEPGSGGAALIILVTGWALSRRR